MQHPIRFGIQIFVGLTIASALLSRVVVLVPTGFAPVLFTVLGPPAWLLWGFGAAPMFVAATAVWFVAVCAAVLICAKWTVRNVAVAASVFCAALWLALGWIALAVAFG